MNDYSGYGEIKIGDKTIRLKFGLNAYKLFCEYHKIDLDKLEEKLLSPFSLPELAYFAYVTAARIQGNIAEISIDEFIEMIGDTKDVVTKIEELIKTSRMWGYTVDELSGLAEKKKSDTVA